MKRRKRKRIVLFIGNSISQLQNDDLLHLLHSALRPGEFVLVGYDLHKSSDVLTAAYRSEEAASANKNVLSCVNRYFDGDFDLDNFEYIVMYNATERRCETHLRSLKDHIVNLRRLDAKVEFEAGESVCTGHQRKFTMQEMQSRFFKTGFSNAGTFTDDHCWYAMTLFRAVQF